MLAPPRLPANAALAARIRCAARSCASSALRPRITEPAFSTAPRSRSVTELDIYCSRGVMTMLANAGLLDGREATTHWGSIERMRKQFPKITVRDDQRVVDAGKVVTSAGVSAGIDGALNVVDRLAGRSIAVKAARYKTCRRQLGYYKHRLPCVAWRLVPLCSGDRPLCRPYEGPAIVLEPHCRLSSGEDYCPLTALLLYH
jgi:hypothetical protein